MHFVTHARHLSVKEHVRLLNPQCEQSTRAYIVVASAAAGIETVTCVYKVSDLSHGAHRFKVDVNAKENHMSGAPGDGCVLKYITACPQASFAAVGMRPDAQQWTLMKWVHGPDTVGAL